MCGESSADMPHLSVALLEDAVAIGGGILTLRLQHPIKD
jgi:hypothetical protein